MSWGKHSGPNPRLAWARSLCVGAINCGAGVCQLTQGQLTQAQLWGRGEEASSHRLNCGAGVCQLTQGQLTQAQLGGKGEEASSHRLNWGRDVPARTEVRKRWHACRKGKSGASTYGSFL